MEQFLEAFTLKMNITIHEDSPIENLYSSIYNGQSLVSTYYIVCVGNGRFFYFNEDGKLDINFIVKIRYPVLKKTNHQFFSLNEMQRVW